LLPSLLVTRSDLIVQDVHGLLTIENIDQSMKNFSQFTYTAYGAGTEYSLGEKVSSGGSNWEYINASASTGNTPAEDTYWTVINEMNDYLIKAVYNGIDRMIDKYMAGKKLRGRTKSIFDQVLLFNGVANYRANEANADKFVGLRLRFRKNNWGLVTILNKIGHQFSSDFVGLTLSLYNTSEQDAIATWSITHAQGKSSQWTSLTADNILEYVDTYGAGTDFYLGYKQSDLESLGAEALNKDITWGSDICASCDSRWANFYKQYSKYIDVIGFEVLETEMPSDVMFDPEEATLTDSKNYGLNINMTTKCDLTAQFLQEEEVLAEALKYHVGMVLLEGMAYNTRGGNQVANQTRAKAEKQLFHHKEAWGTVSDRASAADKGLSFDMSGMNTACMPEDNKTVLNIKRGSV